MVTDYSGLQLIKNQSEIEGDKSYHISQQALKEAILSLITIYIPRTTIEKGGICKFFGRTRIICPR